MGMLLCNGIVTRYANYSENDRILSILTAEHGRIDAKARGCRKPKSPLLPAAQLFVYGEFEIFEGREKATINKCSITQSFYPLREDIERFYLGDAMLRLANDAAQEREQCEALFFLLYYGLTFLTYGESAPEDLFLCFLARYLDVVGYCPSITACGRCGRDMHHDKHIFFSSRHGGAVCAACASGGKEISLLALECIRRMLVMDNQEMDRVRLTESLRQEIRTFLFSLVTDSLDYGARALSNIDKL